MTVLSEQVICEAADYVNKNMLHREVYEVFKLVGCTHIACFIVFARIPVNEMNIAFYKKIVRDGRR